eukprot:UN33626
MPLGCVLQSVNGMNVKNEDHENIVKRLLNITPPVTLRFSVPETVATDPGVEEVEKVEVEQIEEVE